MSARRPATLALRCGPLSVQLDQPPAEGVGVVAAVVNSRALRLFPCGPAQMAPDAVSPFTAIAAAIQALGILPPPAQARSDALRRVRSRTMSSDTVIEPLYELVVNATGAMMLTIGRKTGQPVNPQLIMSETEPQALLKRGGGLPDVALTDLHPDAATLLRAAGEVLVVEAGGPDDLASYLTPIARTSRPF